MKFNILIMFLLIIMTGTSQEIDSTAYKWYHLDPNIDSIRYNKYFYNNGQLKEQGWEMFLSEDNQYTSFDKNTEFDEFGSIGTKIGHYRFYHKNGKIKCHMMVPKDINDTASIVIYNKKGELIKNVTYIENNVLKVKIKNSLRSWYYNSSNFSYYYFKVYSKGKLDYEGYYQNDYERTGCWRKYSKDGKIKKEWLFKDDKVIKKTCSQQKI